MVRNVLRLLGVVLIAALIGSWYYTDGVTGVAGFVGFLLILAAAVSLGVTTFGKLGRYRGADGDDG